MKHQASSSATPIHLGLEAGGTRTVALARGTQTVRREFGPANLRLLDDAQLAAHFRAIADAMPMPTALGIGMAGARTEADRERIRQAAAQAWPRVPCHATNDLETALMAADEVEAKTSTVRLPRARVLVLSGTGSCCFGRTAAGQTAKLGGWGHLLGDKGSGYEIGLRALKAVVYYFDRDGEWSALGERLLRALQLNEPDDLIGWVQRAGKNEIAALAVEVFHAATKRDAIATDILKGAASSLARDAVACARRLVLGRPAVQFVFAGSVLLRQPRFAKSVAREITRLWPKAIATPLPRESVWGAVQLAEHLGGRPPATAARPRRPPEPAGVTSTRLSPTEVRHPLSMNLDRLDLGAAVALMLREDAKIPAALRAERKLIERGVKLIVQSFKKGGRLFYVGAGTSGRLGVLDASECPPTFRTDPEMVQGIIAGGQTALWSAVVERFRR